jgi:hypothetical protein
VGRNDKVEDIPEITPEMIEAGEEVLRQIEIWPPDRAHDLAIGVYQAMSLRRPPQIRPRKHRAKGRLRNGNQ